MTARNFVAVLKMIAMQITKYFTKFNIRSLKISNDEFRFDANARDRK